MHNQRPWLPAILASTALFAAAAASAAGFGTSATAAMLGQPLDFTVQLRLDAGGALAPECVSAEVTVGERKLAAAAVRTAVQMTGAEWARVHVRTSLAVDEPVVGVLLHVGCTSRVSRRFVVLADPPMFAAEAAAVPVAAASPAEAMPAALSSAGTTVEARDAAVPVPAVSSSGALATRAAGPGAQRAERRVERPAPGRVAQNRAGPRAAQQRRLRAPPAAALAGAAPRLKLEAAEPAAAAPVAAVEEALLAVAQAASAARAAASAASATAARIASLERTVEELRGEAKASRDLSAQLRERLQRSEEASRWTLPLLALVLCLTGLAAWMAWRMNSAQRVRQQGWQAAVPAREPLPPPVSTLSGGTPSRQPTAPIPFVTSEIKPPESPRPRGTPAWPPAAPVVMLEGDATQPLTQPLTEPTAPQYPYDSAMARTEVLPARAVEDAAPARDVSIEELIDLEQQAEFFVVLGQDEAAVDLLLEHLRHTGGSSPLPYLKLLEVYRRRGDRAEYERTRTRFNQRFNAYAPEWDADLQAGRALESYPGVLPRLQQVWQRPLDAMAELEALLFRKSRGDLFELPAYRDVLLLYALARDLLDRESADSGNVDLLLPMADGSEFSSTSPAPFLGLERDSRAGNEGAEDRATLPVDLDLTSGHDKPTSLFDTLESLPEAAMRRR